jgi:hypothetical protein
MNLIILFECQEGLGLSESGASISPNTHQLTRVSLFVPCSQVPSTAVIDASQESMEWMKSYAVASLMDRRY